MIKNFVSFIVKSLIGSLIIFLYIYFMAPISFSWLIYGICLGGSGLIVGVYDFVTKVLIERVKSKMVDEDDS